MPAETPENVREKEFTNQSLTR